MKDLDKFDSFFFDENSEGYFYNSDAKYPLYVTKHEDKINNPKHYTQGSQEAIDVIEDAIKVAPDSKTAFNHGQVLKYLLRLWRKENALQDAKKARWYLNRLIDQLGG